VALTYDNNTRAARLYVDGDSVAAATFTDGAVINVAGALVFGAATTAPASALTGRLDELRFWNTVRTSAEINAAYQAPLTGAEAGLLAYWRISEGSGNPVDLVGSLTATLAGPPNDPAWVKEDPILP
jgi:large repetitive protein